jgi:acyl carrier protein
MPSATTTGEHDPAALAAAALAIVRQTYIDLHQRDPPEPITLKTSLDRDLAFDSLARVELVLRIEKAFAVHMPDTVLETAETCGDLVALLSSAAPETVPAVLPRAAVPDVSAIAIPETARTLIEVLDWQARHHGDRVHLRHVEDPLAPGDGQPLRFGELRERAGRVAAGIQVQGLIAGQTVAIMLPTGIDYFVAYFGVLLAGTVPVPIYPPLRPSQIEEHVRRHVSILDNAGVALMITLSQARTVANLLSARVPSLQRVATVADLESATTRGVMFAATPDDLAFIQYTSGSTGSPKGVALSHANLLANIRAFGAASQLGPQTVIVSWLPLYHDMGLIGAWLSSLYYGVPLILMSPLAFLARPQRWLWAIHRFRGTHTVAPNFAYELCLKRIDEAQIRDLDLSSLVVAANGSEQVLPDTLERFAQRFGAYGFDARALLPVYGLAECSVGLLVPPPGRGPRIDRIERATFMREGRALPAAADDAHPLRFVCCGAPIPGHEVRVVDAQGAEVGERVEGRLEFRGPSATRGYYRNAELTQKLFHDGWLDTGDRAYAVDGEIYPTGRVKDIIIRAGRNLYPDEL